MTSFRALRLFQEQLSRLTGGSRFKMKVVLTPSSVKEAGLTIRLAILKSAKDTSTKAAKSTRTLKIRLAVSGQLESLTGLEQALEAIEKLDAYFAGEDLRLEEMVEGANTMQSIRKIPDTRIRQVTSPDDSFIDSPDSIAVQDIEDVRYIYITIPAD